MPSIDSPPNRDQTPLSIGRYQIVCKLGAGGMADVYLAHQPGPFSAGKLLVIKHLKPGIADDEQFVEMFANESRIAVRLNHPNVVHTYEVIAEDNNYYLTLEFLDGKNLRQIRQLCRNPGIPLSLQIWILTQVLSGLHYAHELTNFDGTPLGIVHRDVSPTNVFITYAGEVKLLDFGIAKSLGAVSATREGIVKGKLGYASPEQCLCKPIDRRSDLFSVGVMLWEAIAGRKRALGETDASVYQARVQGLEHRIDEVCPTAPRELVTICNRALEKRPEDRYQSALEFRQALDQYLTTTKFKAGPESMGAFMRDRFDADINTMRRRIDGYLGQSGLNSVPQRSLRDAASADGRASETGRGARAGADGLQHTHTNLNRTDFSNLTHPSLLTGVALVPAVPWYKQGSTWLLLGIGMVSAVSLTVWLVSPRGGIVQQPSVALDAKAATPEEIPRENPGNRAARQVSVSIAAIPTTAVIRLDGRRISNPYRAVHGYDVRPHHLSVTLSGHEPIEEELVLDRDISRSYELERSTSAAGARQVGRGVPGRRIPTTHSASVSSESPPAGASTSAQADPLPGEDMGGVRPSPKPQELDETDPYEK